LDRLLEAWETRAPLHWEANDPGPVADAACFLLCDLAPAITGASLHVDGGYHAMAGALRGPATAPSRSDRERHDRRNPSSRARARLLLLRRLRQLRQRRRARDRCDPGRRAASAAPTDRR
jgi:hypothetical protein